VSGIVILSDIKLMLCYCYGSVSDQLGPSAVNKFDLISAVIGLWCNAV